MGRLTFILGGARSGKSAHAVALAAKYGGKKVVYIATGQGGDGEMQRRIASHRMARPSSWKTYEEPLAISKLLSTVDCGKGVIIVDCLTLLVSNLMLKGNGQKAIEDEVTGFLAKLKKAKARAIIVSNEVGLGIVPVNGLARKFRDIAGSVNKIAAEMSDEVIFMMSGIPCKIKPRRQV